MPHSSGVFLLHFHFGYLLSPHPDFHFPHLKTLCLKTHHLWIGHKRLPSPQTIFLTDKLHLMQRRPIICIKGFQLLTISLALQINIEELYNFCDKHVIWENWIFAQWTSFHMLKYDIPHINLPLYQNVVTLKGL